MVRAMRTALYVWLGLTLFFNASPAANIYKISVSSKSQKGQRVDTIVSQAQFPHPPSLVRAALENYASYKEFFPLMSESSIQGLPDQVKFKFRAKFPIPDFWSLVQFKETSQGNTKTITWKHQKGNIKQNLGTVRIFEDPQDTKKTKLELEFVFDPGAIYPKSTVNKITKDYVYDALEQLGRHIAQIHFEKIRKKKK